jgi:hypothetical protein
MNTDKHRWNSAFLLSVFICVHLWLIGNLQAHNIPSQLPPPLSDGEAWNVLEESAGNIDKLLDANLLRDVMFQIANMDGSLRYLPSHSTDGQIGELSKQLLAEGSDIVGLVREKTPDAEKIRGQWAVYRHGLSALEAKYPKETVDSLIYICPMHPMDRHLDANEKCSICGMALIRRHLPASGVYEKPGEPTMKLAVIGEPLVVGKKADLKIRLARRDGSPVLLSDLVEMHTKKIHLLINDMSLTDYHHEHPVPTDVAGEYAFSFTPARPGPYRVWADVVPANSSVQEYDVADISADTKSLPLTDRRDLSTATTNGRKYTLTMNTRGEPIRAGQTIVGTISVAEADGKPCVVLEPVMGTFAHIVGFNEDMKTVLHIHPFTKNPSGPADRAGPVFAFKFYAPKPGFYRLYGQVQIGGVNQFPPFGVTVLPAAK